MTIKNNLTPTPSQSSIATKLGNLTPLDLKSSLSGEMLLELEVVISLIFVLVSSVGFLY